MEAARRSGGIAATRVCRFLAHFRHSSTSGARGFSGVRRSADPPIQWPDMARFGLVYSWASVGMRPGWPRSAFRALVGVASLRPRVALVSRYSSGDEAGMRGSRFRRNDGHFRDNGVGDCNVRGGAAAAQWAFVVGWGRTAFSITSTDCVRYRMEDSTGGANRRVCVSPSPVPRPALRRSGLREHAAAR